MTRWPRVGIAVATLAGILLAGVGGRGALTRASLAAASPAGSTPGGAPGDTNRTPGFSERDIRDEQIRVWGQALAADPRSALALGQLSALHSQRARETGIWSEYLIAERHARSSLSLRTQRNGKTAATLASVLVAQHRFDEARDVAAALARREPDVPQYRAILGEIALELGDYSLADRMFTSVLAEKEHLSIAPRIARWLELNGHLRDARQTLESARDAAMSRADIPRETKSWFEWRVADLALRGGRLRTAERAFRRGLLIEPDDPRHLTGLARLASVRGRPRDAIAYGDRAISVRLDPDALGIVGDAYAALCDSAKAAEYFQTMEVAVSAEPGPFHRTWSLHLLDRGARVNQVLKESLASLELRRDIFSDDLAAWALHRAGRNAEALVASQRALRFGTPDALLWYHRGAIERALGRDTDARLSFQRALEINSRFHPVHAEVTRAHLVSLTRAGL